MQSHTAMNLVNLEVRFHRTSRQYCATCHSSKVSKPVEFPLKRDFGPDKAASVTVVPASPVLYWQAAAVHVASFPPASEFLLPFALLDRVLSFEIGLKQSKLHNLGQFSCLVATTDGLHYCVPSPLTAFWAQVFQFVLPKQLSVGMCYKSANVIGAVVLDTFGVYIPARKKGSKRLGICYISNLAILPNWRNYGLGRLMMQNAEETARIWGCRSVALHVDPTNNTAMHLYKSLGYRIVGHQSRWDCFLEARKVPLVLMLKKINNLIK